jgi:hypothetical protein
MYDLKIKSYVITPQGIVLEPGRKQLAVEQIEVENVGDMPTPPTAEIILGVYNSDFVSFDEENALAIGQV